MTVKEIKNPVYFIELDYKCKPFFKDFLFTNGKFNHKGYTTAITVEKNTMYLTSETKEVAKRCIKELKPITSVFINQFKGELKDRFEYSYSVIRRQFYNE